MAKWYSIIFNVCFSLVNSVMYGEPFSHLILIYRYLQLFVDISKYLKISAIYLEISLTKLRYPNLV